MESQGCKSNSTVRWISLSVGLFDDDKIAIIESMPDGDSLLNCWLRLLCMAGKQNAGGYIYATQSIAYTDDMLAAMWKKKPTTVKLALRTFKDLEMLDIEADGKIFLNNFQKWQEPLVKIQANRDATRNRVSEWRKKRALMPKEESTKEESTVHNSTVQGNSNSNRYNTATKRVQTNTIKTKRQYPFIAEAIKREAPAKVREAFFNDYAKWMEYYRSAEPTVVQMIKKIEYSLST